MALLAAVALSRRPPELPDARPAALLGASASVAPEAPDEPRAPQWVQRMDTLGRGEVLTTLFARQGLPGSAVMAALRDTPAFDERRIPAGLPVTLRNLDTDSLPSEIVLQFGVDRLVRLTRGDDGAWAGEEERIPWSTDTAVVAGTIGSSLYAALETAAEQVLPARLRAELAWSLADILEYRVDMSRDLKAGDAFRVAFERRTTPTGAVTVGRVLAVSMSLSGDTVQAFHFASDKEGKGQYYDQNGRTLRAAFLRAPLEFRRISSVFGRRKHPILGTWKSHKGTDYAASTGTPVRTVGDGVIHFVGRRGGYGNVVEVKHPNGYISRYAHLSRFGKGAARGSRVSIGQTIGYVGMTGLATGPHLHFEVLVGGVQRDPSVALRDKAGVPLQDRDKAAFQALRSQMLATLDRVEDASGGATVRLAAAHD
ncbi:MAG TPA: M23 family metallopeptidase [Gemmatimonadaceae bacterium]|nr:M23 family metallopeptidase [Gemmatimonadaceae bacterium]